MKKLFTLALAASMSIGASFGPATASLHAQAVSVNGGSIQGTITDPTGAIVPGASVTIRGTDTGFVKTITTDSSGFYSVGPLNPGNYNVSVNAPGFQKLSVTTVIRTGTATPGSFKLTLGANSETVEVNAGSIQINTDQIAVSGVVTQEQIDTLPINGRNILDVAQIQPGVILQSGVSFDPTKAGYSALSVSGVGGRTTRILLDGQDITDETVGTTIFNVPSGAVGELQLNRSTQDISGEVTSTGQVLMSTRSGTNSLHGNVFYNFQDYRAGFANVNGTPAPFQRNQFGGYVGGPIIKDKLFFFGGAERIKQTESDVAQGSTTFAAILAKYPFIPAPFHDTYSTGRLDYSGPRGIHFFARATYSVNSDDATFGYGPYQIYQNRDNVPALVGGADFATGRITHSFRVGYEKFHNLLQDGTAALGNSIYNPSTSPANQVTLVGSLNAGPNFLAPQGTFQSDKQFRYDGTWTKGSHTVKFGGEVNRILNGGFAAFYGPSLYTALAAVPSLEVANCLGTGTTCPNDPVNGYIAAAYVIGNGNGLFSERPGFGLPGGGDPSWRIASYVGDTWKATTFLTLTAGLRWSVDTDRANQDLPTPLCSSVDPSLQFTGCTGATPLFDQYQVGLGKQTHQPYGNFGPQLGFVFSPGDHKTSIRGGIGIYYDSDVFNNTGNSRTESIQTPGAYFNYGVANAGGTSIILPGYGKVTSAPDGTPVSTILSESIALAAPEVNAIKAAYQAKVKGVSSSNPSYIGTGDDLFANSIYAGPYLSPYSIQYNGGLQRELGKGLIVSVDYVHNSTIKVPLSVDVNHNGAARTLNVTAAKNAIAATTAGANCVGGTSAAAISCAIAYYGPSAALSAFAGNGLDSGAAYLQNVSPAAFGLTPNTGAAFAGTNPNVGTGLFILPVGRSGYDALQAVVQEQRAHPLPGILTSNVQVSYSLSRIVSATSAGNSDQFFAGARPYYNDSPTQYIGRSNLDHTNELSFGGSVGIKYGIQAGFIGHFYSAPPSSLVLDASSGATGQIFQTDVDGDGTTGDLIPGTNPGDYMHRVKPSNLGAFIQNFNATHANQLTPAGQALVNNGLFTQNQLVAIGAAIQPIAGLPQPRALSNSAFRTFDLNASYPIRLTRFREGLSLVPGVAMYNVFNMSNFGSFVGTLLNAGDAGQPSYLNGPSSQAVLNSNRTNRNSGTFDQGGPRTTEFQLKLNF